MSFKILKPAEIVSKKTISAIIYGQKGGGKTTLAFSAPSPVLFDFDGGVSRVGFGFEKDVIVLDKFSDYADALAYVATSSYKTIVVDTLTKLVDMATIEQCGFGIPSPRDYQIIYGKVKTFIRAVNASGRHLIFVAQDIEVKKSGKTDTFHRPECPDKVYNAIAADMDIIGYLYYEVKQGADVRTITFSPTAYNEGKNTAEFENQYSIPTATAEKPLTFMTDIINYFVNYQTKKDAMRAELGKRADEAVAQYREELAKVDDAISMNDFLTRLMKAPAIGDSKVRIKHELVQKANELGLTFNKETSLYE